MVLPYHTGRRRIIRKDRDTGTIRIRGIQVLNLSNSSHFSSIDAGLLGFFDDLTQ